MDDKMKERYFFYTETVRCEFDLKRYLSSHENVHATSKDKRKKISRHLGDKELLLSIQIQSLEAESKYPQRWRGIKMKQEGLAA